jgi:hypothetical protein
MKPVVPDDQQRHERLRRLWAAEESLARACWRYANATGDAAFAVQEMVRSQLARPLPGIWHHLPLAVRQLPGLMDAIDHALSEQRERLRRASRGRYTQLAMLQQSALLALAQAQLAATSTSVSFDVIIAEARCQDLVRTAQLVVEQDAMREAAYELGDDHPADLEACHGLYLAAEEAIAGFEEKLQAGHSLAEALAVDILLEAEFSLPPGSPA